MNKKPYEWLLYLSIPFLVHGCFRFQNEGKVGYAAACTAALVAIAVYYYYFVKYRPMQVHRGTLGDVASAHGFRAASEVIADHVAALLREFPFDDTSVKADTVHFRTDPAATIYLGRYATGGSGGIHFGFFLLAAFRPRDPRPMFADITRGEAWATGDEREPIIDPRLTAALTPLRFDCFVRGTSILVDFDTREIRSADFARELARAVEQVPGLGAMFEADRWSAPLPPR